MKKYVPLTFDLRQGAFLYYPKMILSLKNVPPSFPLRVKQFIFEVSTNENGSQRREALLLGRWKNPPCLHAYATKLEFCRLPPPLRDNFRRF